jgi:hypothetical protein
MKLTKGEKIALTIALSVWLFISVNVWLTKAINQANIELINGHFKKIEKEQHAKESLHYDLMIQENNNSYRISADWTDCFQYSGFIKDVKENTPIKISIGNDNGIFKFSNVPMVVSLVVDGREYLNRDCINNDIKNKKTEIPLFSIAAIIIGFAVYKYKQNNKKGHR